MPQIKTSLKKVLSLLALSIILVAGAWVGWNSFSNNQGQTAKAAFNSSFSRYEDTLTDSNTVASYSYTFSNTSPSDAPGYFLLSLQSFSQAQVNNEIEFASITQTFPVDATTHEPNPNSTIITENVNQVSYLSGNIVYIKLSPGTACVSDPNGGCQQGQIPAGVPIRIDINLKMKAGLTSSDVLDGTGKVIFPNGFDVNAINWRINLNPSTTSPIPVVNPPKVTLNQASIGGSVLNLDFSTTNYTNTPGGIHTHFYFDTESNTVVNKMFSGASPYVLSLSSIPENATQICAIVANPNHTIIPDSGNCVALPQLGNGGTSGDNQSIQIAIPTPYSAFLAGVPTTFQFILKNQTSSQSNIYATIGDVQNFWSSIKSTTLKPTQDCVISVSQGSTFTGSCDDLFSNNGFNVSNVPPGGTVTVKVSKVINLIKPNSGTDELNFRIFSSTINDFSPQGQPNYITLSYNSKYDKSLRLTKEKVSTSSKYGGDLAFAQIVSPYNDVIFAIDIKNLSQVSYTGLNLHDALDSNAQNYFNGCSFSQAQTINAISPNGVSANLQGVSGNNLKDYTLNNITIPASTDNTVGEVVFYVGCSRNNAPLLADQKIYNQAQVVSFDNMSDSFYSLPQDLSTKADMGSNQNLKIEKVLVTKSSPNITAGTQATYKIRVTNTSTSSSGEISIADLMQVPSGVLVQTSANVIGDGMVNPLQDGSTTNKVVDISSNTGGLASAYPSNLSGADSLGNTARVFKINKLKAGDKFEFNYSVFYRGIIPTTCDINNSLLNVPILRNTALLTSGGINNGNSILGGNILTVGAVPSAVQFTTMGGNLSVNFANNILFSDNDLSDNIAVVDLTPSICKGTSDESADEGTSGGSSGSGSGSTLGSVLTTNDIPNLKVQCLPVTAGTPTTCSFQLSTQTQLPTNFTIGIGDSVMSSCQRINFNPENQNSTETSPFAVCKNVATPALGQSTLIFAQIGTGPRTLTSQKLAYNKSAGINLTLTPSNNQLQVGFNLQNTQFSAAVPDFKISLNEGDNLASFEAATIQLNSDTSATLSNLVPCTSYKLKFSLNDSLGNLLTSSIQDFKTTGCVDNKQIVSEKTVPISSTTGGNVALVTGDDRLDLTLPPNFSTGDKKIQAKKINQTGSTLTSLPKIPKSERLAKNKTFDLKAFSGTSSLTTTFTQPLTIKINYTDQDVNLLDKTSLSIKSWDGISWTDLTDCTNDQTNKTVTCSTTHFSLFALTGQTALDVGDVKWVFGPASGSTAPIFKDTSPITVKLTGFASSRNNVPNAGDFVCKIEMQPIKSNPPAYTLIADNLPYTPNAGCGTQITKAQRQNFLKLRLKTTITSTSNVNQSYTFFYNYILNFKGAGTSNPSL